MSGGQAPPLFPDEAEKKGGGAVLSGHTRTPAQVIGELLSGHPEAASLQAEASHCQALARGSAAYASQAFDDAQAARLGYEELRHRLDPRRVRTVGLSAGLLALILLSTGLALLDGVDLSGVLGPVGSVLPAVASTAVWLAGAWVAALASREHRLGVCIAAGTIGGLLGLLLAALRGFGHQNVLLGILVSVFILVLAGAAAVLMARMESSSLFAARWRWHRVQRVHRAAVRIERDDMQAAAVATESWLCLVRTRASVLANDERFVQETVALAIDLLESGHLHHGQIEARLGVGAGARVSESRA